MFNFCCTDNESVQLTFLDIFGNTCNKITGHHLLLALSGLDCEQSLFFFRFSESNARSRERQSRETRETRAAALSRLAPSVTRVAICVSRVLLDGLQKKERLLVVYFRVWRLIVEARANVEVCSYLKRGKKNGNIAPVLILPVLAFQLSLCESLVPLCSGGTLNILPRLRP